MPEEQTLNLAEWRDTREPGGKKNTTYNQKENQRYTQALRITWNQHEHDPKLKLEEGTFATLNLKTWARRESGGWVKVLIHINQFKTFRSSIVSHLHLIRILSRTSTQSQPVQGTF
jgi:hypothetical protein